MTRIHLPHCGQPVDDTATCVRPRMHVGHCSKFADNNCNRPPEHRGWCPDNGLTYGQWLERGGMWHRPGNPPYPESAPTTEYGAPPIVTYPPVPDIKLGMWPCPDCTIDNAHYREICRECGTRRPGEEGPQ